MLVDFSAAPDEPLPRLMWLSGVREQVQEELDAEYRRAYFTARTQGPEMFEAALALNLHSRKRAIAFTRQENDRRGRPLKWGDHLDGY